MGKSACGRGIWFVANESTRLFSGYSAKTFESATHKSPLAYATPLAPPTRFEAVPGCPLVKSGWPISALAAWPVTQFCALTIQAKKRKTENKLDRKQCPKCQLKSPEPRLLRLLGNLPGREATLTPQAS